MAIKINTSRVEASAAMIESHNKTIRNDFDAVINAMNILNRNWDGSASDDAIRTFNRIRDEYADNRYAAIHNLVSFLRVTVASNYEETENQIKSAADAFK